MSNLECPGCGAPWPLVSKPANWNQALWGGRTCPQCHGEFDRWGRRKGYQGGPRRTQTLDDTNRAANPIGLTLSDAKLRVLRPDLYRPLQRLREAFRIAFPQRLYLAEQLQHLDSRAAVVVSVAPLLVAAYTDELDCVAILEFPAEFVAEYRLRVGARLLTINAYKEPPQYPDFDDDLFLGPNRFDRATGFHPIIADFLSDDAEVILRRKKAIAHEEWQRAYRMGLEYLKLRPGVARDGRPVFASEPAERTEET